ASARLQLRHWRMGPASLSPEDAAYRHQAVVAGGAGLRPLSPCHLRIEGRVVRWIRRTRVDGDSWEAPEVPLGEASERYLLRLLRADIELHRAEMTGPEYEIPASVWAAARAGGGFAVAVAQLSELYGPGPSVRRNVDV